MRRWAGRKAVDTYELDSSAREERSDDTTDGPPMSLAELEASAKRVLGVDVPCGRVARTEPLDPASVFGIKLENRVAIPGSAGVSGRRCRARPLADRWTGSQLGLQDAVNRLEAGGRSSGG